MSKSGFTLRAHIESFGGLNNVSFDMKDRMIMGIIGDGGEGKSSLMNFLRAIFSGDFDSNAINTFTKQAKGRATIERDGKTYTVVLSKTKKSETVKITCPDQPDGAKTKLQEIFGDVLLDPFKLKDMKLKEQADSIREIFNIDTNKFDKDHSTLYTERTAINKSAETLAVSISNNPHNTIDLEGRYEHFELEKDLKAIEERRTLAWERKNAVAIHKLNLENLRKEKVRLDRQNEDLENQIKAIQAQIQLNNTKTFETIDAINTENIWLIDNEELAEKVEEVEQEYKDAVEFNQNRKDFQAFVADAQSYDEITKESKRMTQELKDIASDREKYIRSKIGGIHGMEILEKKYGEDGKIIDDREGVYFLNKPLQVLSTTEMFKFCMLVRKAVNGNTIPLILMDSFEKVGTFAEKEIVKMCQEEGWHAIVAERKDNLPLQIILKNDLDFEKTDATTEIYPIDKKQKFPDKGQPQA